MLTGCLLRTSFTQSKRILYSCQHGSKGFSSRDVFVSFDFTHHVCKGSSLYRRRFESVLSFHSPEGFAAVQDIQNRGAYHIDESGNSICDTRYKRTFGFYQRLAAVVDFSDRWYHISVDGKPAYGARWDWCGNFAKVPPKSDTESSSSFELRCPVMRKENEYADRCSYYYIDAKGETTSGPYSYAGDYNSHGEAAVSMLSGEAAIVDISGQEVFTMAEQQKLFDATPPHKGIASARDKDGWFFIDRHGKEVIKGGVRFKEVEPFYNGRAKVCLLTGQQAVIDKMGAVIALLPQSSDEIDASLLTLSMSYWQPMALKVALELGVLDSIAPPSSPSSSSTSAPSPRLRPSPPPRPPPSFSRSSGISYDDHRAAADNVETLSVAARTTSSLTTTVADDASDSSSTSSSHSATDSKSAAVVAEDDTAFVTSKRSMPPSSISSLATDPKFRSILLAACADMGLVTKKKLKMEAVAALRPPVTGSDTDRSTLANDQLYVLTDKGVRLRSQHIVHNSYSDLKVDSSSAAAAAAAITSDRVRYWLQDRYVKAWLPTITTIDLHDHHHHEGHKVPSSVSPSSSTTNTTVSSPPQQQPLQQQLLPDTFEDLSHDPASVALSQRVLASYAAQDWRGITDLLLPAMMHNGHQHICDIAGGTGSLLTEIGYAYDSKKKEDVNAKTSSTSLALTCMERKEVVDFARTQQQLSHTQASPASPTITFVAGDLFTGPIPTADLYLLSRVLHDWDDDRATQILTRIRELSPPHAQLCVIDRQATEENPHTWLSLHMYLLQRSYERTSHEWDALFKRSGWCLVSKAALKSHAVMTLRKVCDCGSNIGNAAAGASVGNSHSPRTSTSPATPASPLTTVTMNSIVGKSEHAHGTTTSPSSEPSVRPVAATMASRPPYSSAAAAADHAARRRSNGKRRVTKAVLPIAGLGTRMHPASSLLPKALLPFVVPVPVLGPGAGGGVEYSIVPALQVLLQDLLKPAIMGDVVSGSGSGDTDAGAIQEVCVVVSPHQKVLVESFLSSLRWNETNNAIISDAPEDPHYAARNCGGGSCPINHKNNDRDRRHDDCTKKACEGKQSGTAAATASTTASTSSSSIPAAGGMKTTATTPSSKDDDDCILSVASPPSSPSSSTSSSTSSFLNGTIQVVVQNKPLGFGDAVLQADEFVGEESSAFMVVLGDHLYSPGCFQEVFASYDSLCCAAAVSKSEEGRDMSRRGLARRGGGHEEEAVEEPTSAAGANDVNHDDIGLTGVVLCNESEVRSTGLLCLQDMTTASAAATVVVSSARSASDAASNDNSPLDRGWRKQRVVAMIEKPQKPHEYKSFEVMANSVAKAEKKEGSRYLSQLGVDILPRSIFKYLRNEQQRLNTTATTATAGTAGIAGSPPSSELQLRAAMKLFMEEKGGQGQGRCKEIEGKGEVAAGTEGAEGLYGCLVSSQRYDFGNPQAYYKSFRAFTEDCLPLPMTTWKLPSKADLIHWLLSPTSFSPLPSDVKRGLTSSLSSIAASMTDDNSSSDNSSSSSNSSDRVFFVASSPGRVDLMGGIADYSGASVLQYPTRRRTYALISFLDSHSEDEESASATENKKKEEEKKEETKKSRNVVEMYSVHVKSLEELCDGKKEKEMSSNGTNASNTPILWKRSVSTDVFFSKRKDREMQLQQKELHLNVKEDEQDVLHLVDNAVLAKALKEKLPKEGGEGELAPGEAHHWPHYILGVIHALYLEECSINKGRSPCWASTLPPPPLSSPLHPRPPPFSPPPAPLPEVSVQAALLRMLKRGLTVIIVSDIPTNAGIASSAALEVSTMKALQAALIDCGRSRNVDDANAADDDGPMKALQAALTVSDCASSRDEANAATAVVGAVGASTSVEEADTGARSSGPYKLCDTLQLPQQAIDSSSTKLALLCQHVENGTVGAPCGFMDHIAVSHAVENHLLSFSCKSPFDPFSIVPVRLPDDLEVWAINSGAKRDVKGDAYVTVRVASLMGKRIINIVRRDAGEAPIHDLCELTAADFHIRGYGVILPKTMMGSAFLDTYGEELFEEAQQPTAEGLTERCAPSLPSVLRVKADVEYPVYQATVHPIEENERVRRFKNILTLLNGGGDNTATTSTLEEDRKSTVISSSSSEEEHRRRRDDDLKSTLASLMADSHRSYSALGLGSPNTDLLVDLVRTEISAGAGAVGGTTTVTRRISAFNYQHQRRRCSGGTGGGDYNVLIGGLIGAKITGGGSGGAVAVLAKKGSGRLINRICLEYTLKTGIVCEAVIGGSSGSARVEI